MNSINVEAASVSYPLYDAENSSLKASLINLMKGRIVKERMHDALLDVSIKIENGERVCLVGANGAGKSTLLKALVGIIKPSSGSIVVEGKISSLLDFATGFEMEMTGYDNIFIRGLLLGMSRCEILDKRDEIIDFSGLGDFIDQPVKTYSSGMFVRLAFSVATSIDPDVLIVDEIMGAGDAAFTTKAERRMFSMLDKGNIVVMATHSTELARRLCTRAIWLHEGNVRMDGDIHEVLDSYIESAGI